MVDLQALWHGLIEGLKLLEPLGTIATTTVALFVYFEARRIRKIEWFAKSTENWQAFNALVISTNMDDRWHHIVSGAVAWEKITRRDLMILYSYLNVLVFEYQASRVGLLHRHYVSKSLRDNIAQLLGLCPELIEHLDGDGWPAEFVTVLREALAARPVAIAAVAAEVLLDPSQPQ